MKLTDGLFLRTAEQIHRQEFPEVELETVIIDAGCMKMVQNPERFEVLLMENLYGDVVSDLCAGLGRRSRGRAGGESGGAESGLRSGSWLGPRYRRAKRCQSLGSFDVGG